MKRSILVVMTVLAALGSSFAHAGGGCHSRGRGIARSGLRQPVRHNVYPSRPAYASKVNYATPPAPEGPSYVATQTPVTPPTVAATTVDRSERIDRATPADRIAEATKAFRAGDQSKALTIVDQLIADVPSNADLLQFRSLIHLRSGNVKKSAFDAYEAAKVGTIWTSTQVESIYADKELYQNDVRLVRIKAKGNLRNLDAHFLSAYHHLVAGELEEGRQVLGTVLLIQPKEPIAVALLDAVEASTPSSSDQLVAVNP